MGLAGFVILAGAGFQYYVGGLLYGHCRKKTRRESPKLGELRAWIRFIWRSGRVYFM